MKPIYLEPIPVAVAQIEPLADFVLVRRLPDLASTRIILKQSENDPRRGLVVAIGPGDALAGGARAAMHVKPGDQILYWRCPANDVSIAGEDYCFLHEEQHILGVIDP